MLVKIWGSTIRPEAINFGFFMQKWRSGQFFTLKGHYLVKILWSKGKRPQK
jgi:hypothetical protein